MAVKSDIEMLKEEMRKRDLLKQTNEVRLAGVVMEITALPKSQKIDKKGNAVLDENNNPTFYDEMFWITIGVIGSEEGVLLSAEQVGLIEVGKTYLFVGRLKNRKFKVENIQEI
jgi:hypothetical protein